MVLCDIGLRHVPREDAPKRLASGGIDQRQEQVQAQESDRPEEQTGMDEPDVQPAGNDYHDQAGDNEATHREEDKQPVELLAGIEAAGAR